MAVSQTGQNQVLLATARSIETASASTRMQRLGYRLGRWVPVCSGLLSNPIGQSKTLGSPDMNATLA